MNITREIIEELIAGSFSHELIELTITQQTIENPEVFTGSGFLYYKDNKPYLRFLHKEPDAQTRAYPTYSDLNFGELIGEKHLFALKATDLNGNVWCAKNLDPYPNMKVSQKGISINCRLFEIRRITEHNFKKHITSFFMPQKINIPCNEFQDLGERGKRRTRSSFELDNIKVIILVEDNYTKVHIESEDAFTFEYANTILESLSVASGLLLSPAIAAHQILNSNELILREINNKSKNNLMEFIPQKAPLYLNEWIKFIQAYINKFGTDKTFYYYWLKIFNAHQSDLENETLSLTVSIEGVVNKFHSNFKNDDIEFIRLCGESTSAIEKLDINERVKSSIISFLQRNGKSSPKGALINMAAKGLFPKELATAWSSARNKSAHAEHFKNHSWQKNVDNYVSCLSLFYILLTYHIEYTGLFHHHHLPSAPLQSLNFIMIENT